MNAGKINRIALWVNESCAFGKGKKRWQEFAKVCESRLTTAFTNLDSGKTCDEWVKECLNQGIERFVAVGGDGTVNLVVNALANVSKREVCLGAIGTGSSNDFHKPAGERIAGFPCRLNFDSPVKADLFHVRDLQTGEVRYGLVNASIGITAEANHYFNHPDKVLRALKKRSVNLSILYAALRTLRRYRPQALRMQGESISRSVHVTNLGLIKNRHFSGTFKYDESADADSGDYFVYLCHDLGKFASLKALLQLSKGIFVKSAHTHKFRSTRLRVQGTERFAFELDGEVMRTNGVEIGVEPKRLWLCA